MGSSNSSSSIISSHSNINNQATDPQALNRSQTLNQNGCATFSASSDNSSQISASDESSSFGGNNQNISNSNCNSNSSSSSEDEPQAETLSFFNETLDLSHEDIQRTLIANMPANAVGGESVAAAAAAAVAATVAKAKNNHQETEPKTALRTASANKAEEDETNDVFANLDAFDMLVEFPELDLDDKQALNNTALEQGSYLGEATPSQQHHHPHQQPRKALNICDFSPEWSYTEGGVKVLVAGPWSSSHGAAYTVLFDAQPVPTQLVQEEFCAATVLPMRRAL